MIINQMWRIDFSFALARETETAARAERRKRVCAGGGGRSVVGCNKSVMLGQGTHSGESLALSATTTVTVAFVALCLGL